MLLLHPVPTSADAGCDLCTLCPDLCTLHPDLWILCLWCFPSFNWCKHSTCTGGGCHQLQLALVVLFHSATSADSLLAHMVASPSATCAGGCFFIHPLAQILHLRPGNLHCVVVVYVHIYLYCIYKYKLPWQYKMATWTLPILLPVALQINIFFNKPEATDATLRHKPVLRRRYMKSGAFTDRGSSKLVACGLFLLYNVQSSKYCQKNVHTSEIHHS